ncbi:MAG: ligase-associated DNA damage response DEXH box helicase [Pseudomonadota bacterium]
MLAFDQQLLPAPFGDWFAARGWAPRPHQLELVRRSAEKLSTLLIAPTGAGKTLAGFLPSLIELAPLARESARRPHRLHTLYISPLKALTTDVARNLETPVSEMGLNLRIETRTGDTPPSKRTRQRAHPPDILLTTPEQLCLLIASQHARVFFEDLQTVIIDEIHALAPTKRGDLLALALGRIARWAPNHRRIGLSATVADPDALAQWLVGVAPSPLPRGEGAAQSAAGEGRGNKQTLDRLNAPHPPTPSPRGRGGASSIIVQAPPGAPPDIDVLDSNAQIPWAGHTARHAMPEVYDAIRRARLALVFVNTRAQAEMTFQELWRVNDDGLPIALHHGSLDVGQRRKVEGAMARGELRAVVCTSTLDLGIDWGDVDLVIQIGAPKGCARLVQRIGRANHRLDEPSRALLAPSNRFEVLECRAAQEAVDEGALDGADTRIGGLDCLAQHIMGSACGEPFDADELYEEVASTLPYAALTREQFDRALDLVATGGYALRVYERYRRIVQDPHDGRWRARNAHVAQQHRMNVGAIIEADMLNVRLVSSPARGGSVRRCASDEGGGAPPSARNRPLIAGRRLGQIEEYFIEGLSPGDTFIFAGQMLRFVGLRENDALVTRAVGEENPRIPSYAGGKFPLSTFLASRVRRMIHEPAHQNALSPQVRDWLLMQKLRSIVPAPDQMLVETFPRGPKHFFIAYPFEGRLAHQTLGMLITRRLERLNKHPLGFLASEYAMCVWGLEPMGDVDLDKLFDEDMLGDDLEAWLAESALMKRTFRNCAVIAGMIERCMPGAEKTGRQVNFSADLIYDVLREHEPNHILLEAAFADAGEGYLDLKRLGALLRRVKGRILHMDLPHVSPFGAPVMLEMGRVPIQGGAEEAILEDAASDIIAEAMS